VEFLDGAVNTVTRMNFQAAVAAAEGGVPIAPPLLPTKYELAIEFVDYGDVGVNLYGTAVERGRLVTPLTYGVESGLSKHRVAREKLQGADRAIGGDDGVQFDSAFAASLQCERRKHRFDAVDEHGRVEMADADDGWLGCARDSRLRIRFANQRDAL
jgi:hypothetical protein